MKILIYGINFFPELTGVGKYTGEMSCWLSARGHEVRVVTAPPYYPAWELGVGFRNSYQNILWQGVYVQRVPLWVPVQPSGAKRLLHLTSFALASLPVLLLQVFWRPHVVWVVEPALFCAPAAAAVARLSGAKAWLHVQDFEVDAAFELGLLKGQRIRNWVSAAERWLMRRFDVVSTISERMLDRLKAKGVDESNLRRAVNWVDLDAFRQSTGAGVAAYRELLNIPDGAVVAMYSGNMGGKQGLEVLGDAARILSSAESGSAGQVVFVFCGDGSGRADLVDRSSGLANVRFIGLQPAENLPDLLSLADIHLLPQRADAADLVMPSKLTGMLASARAVVATANPGTELAGVVQQCGLVVPPENADALAQAIVRLASDGALRATLGAAGYRYAQANLDRESVLAQLERDMVRLVEKRS